MTATRIAVGALGVAVALFAGAWQLQDSAATDLAEAKRLQSAEAEGGGDASGRSCSVVQPTVVRHSAATVVAPTSMRTEDNRSLHSPTGPRPVARCILPRYRDTPTGPGTRLCVLGPTGL